MAVAGLTRMAGSQERGQQGAGQKHGPAGLGLCAAEIGADCSVLLPGRRSCIYPRPAVSHGPRKLRKEDFTALRPAPSRRPLRFHLPAAARPPAPGLTGRRGRGDGGRAGRRCPHPATVRRPAPSPAQRSQCSAVPQPSAVPRRCRRGGQGSRPACGSSRPVAAEETAAWGAPAWGSCWARRRV